MMIRLPFSSFSIPSTPISISVPGPSSSSPPSIAAATWPNEGSDPTSTVHFPFAPPLTTLYYSLRHVTYDPHVHAFLVHNPSPELEELLTKEIPGTFGHIPPPDPDTGEPVHQAWAEVFENGEQPYLAWPTLAITRTPYNSSACPATEPRPTFFTQIQGGFNCLACNQGHVVMNMLNPLLVMAKAVFGSSVLLPIPNALLVTVWQGPASGQSPPGRKPVWLFDFVTSKMFGEGSTGTRGYMNLMEAGTCFDEVHMPVPSRGTFDAMAVDLKGRWGTGDFYKTYWRETKEAILRAYGVPVSPAPALRWPDAEAALARKPRVLWAWRGGGGTARDDLNMTKVKAVLGRRADVEFLEDEVDFVWSKDQRELDAANSRLLAKIQDADVLIGQFGANLWNALFLREGSVQIELRSTYGYCGNENGKVLSNHNRLGYYQGDPRDMVVTEDDAGDRGVLYTDEFLRRLAEEIREVYEYEVNNQLPAGTDASGECDAEWPSLWQPGSKILTGAESRHCYLERTEAGDWFQLFTHRNTNKCVGEDGIMEEFPVDFDPHTISRSCPEFCT